MHPRRPIAASVAALAALALAGCGAPAADEAGLRERGSLDLAGLTDQYVGYFEDMPAPAGAATVASGTFGPPRGTAPFALDDRTVPPGEYAVTVECAGASAVDAGVLPDAEHHDGRTEPIASTRCPASVTFPLTVTEAGYGIVLDSGGEVGAYRLSVTGLG